MSGLLRLIAAAKNADTYRLRSYATQGSMYGKYKNAYPVDSLHKLVVANRMVDVVWYPNHCHPFPWCPVAQSNQPNIHL